MQESRPSIGNASASSKIPRISSRNNLDRAGARTEQKSPMGQFENADLDDYDEEIDEFAGYSGSQAHTLSQ